MTLLNSKYAKEVRVDSITLYFITSPHLTHLNTSFWFFCALVKTTVG